MFKKTIAALLAIAIVISFVGCEGVKKDSVPKRKYDKTDPSAVLEEITNDFNAVALYITEELEKTYSDVGTTFEAYQKNKGQIDEYVTFIKKYEEEGKPASMLADYTKMMTQYSEFAAAMAEYESEELSDADAAYLIQVNARVQAKLLTLN